MRLLQKIRNIKYNKLSLLIGGLFVVAGALLLTAGSPVAPTASAADECTTGNNIIRSGINSPTDFINKVSGSAELQHIYQDARFGNGLSSSQYNDFKANARHGHTDRNGNVYLDNGTKVASGAGSIGRDLGCQGSGAKTFNIAGNTYYGNNNAQSINPNTPNLDVYVLLNSDGKATFAVIINCGNPLYFPSPPTPTPPPVPVYNCTAIQAIQNKSKPQEYTFTTSATASGGASIMFARYDFNDGSGYRSIKGAPYTYVHDFADAGTYTVKVSIHVNVNGTEKVVAPAGNCITRVTVPQPSYACAQLTSVLLDSTHNTYQMTVTASYDNTAYPTSADFDFGDGHKKTVSMKRTDKTATYKNTYTLPATDNSKIYQAIAVLHFTAYGQSQAVTSQKCKTNILVNIPYCEGLTASVIDNNTRRTQFTATATLNGRKLDSATFVYGDGKSDTVKPTTNSTAVVIHNYPTGSYNAVATLRFSGTNGIYTAPNCTAVCKPNAPTCVSECKPDIPVGDVRCNPCPTNPTYPASDTEHCVVPAGSLPNTGAGNTIAIFSAVVVGGFLIYRQVIYRQHKMAFVAAERGTSALPLADALDSETPLAGTPLAPGRRSFRRKRQF